MRWMLLSSLILAGCVEMSMDPRVVGMPNPASVHCAKLGGRLEIRTAPDGGQSGWCGLPNGQIIEEWALYRRDHEA